MNLKAQTSDSRIGQMEIIENGALNSIASKICCTDYCSESDAPPNCIATIRQGAVCGECVNGQGEVGVYTQDLQTPSGDTTFESPIVGINITSELESIMSVNVQSMKLISEKSDSLNLYENMIQNEILFRLRKPGNVKKLKSLMDKKNSLANDLIRLNRIQSKISVFALNYYMYKESIKPIK